MRELERALKPVKRRTRQKRAALWGAYGLFAAGACAVLLRAGSFLWMFPAWVGWAAALLVLLPALMALAAWLWPISTLDAARQADALGLEARAQTAVMLESCDTPMALLQRADALQKLRAFDPAAHMRIQMPKWTWLGLLACMALIAVSFCIPDPQADALRAREALRAEMQQQAEKVDEGAAALDDKAAETPQLRRLLGELSLGLTRTESVRDALSVVDELERKVADMQSRTAADALQAMNASGLDALTAALESKDMEAAQQALADQGAQAASALSQAAAKAATQSAKQQLSGAAQALSAGNASQALSMLASAASGQTPASAQALALSGMVRSAAARAGAQSSTATLLLQSGQGAQSGMGGTSSARSQNGVAGSGAGSGTSNKDGGITVAQAAQSQRANRPPEEKTSEYEAIYDPTRLGGAGETHYERGQMGEGEITEAVAGTGAGSLEGSVPYADVLPEYQQAAVEAAYNAELPAYAQQWVEAYFEALAQ